jgi:hypothetical protein
MTIDPPPSTSRRARATVPVSWADRIAMRRAATYRASVGSRVEPAAENDPSTNVSRSRMKTSS